MACFVACVYWCGWLPLLMEKMNKFFFYCDQNRTRDFFFQIKLKIPQALIRSINCEEKLKIQGSDIKFYVEQ
jgi:hypothetical protein